MRRQTRTLQSEQVLSSLWNRFNAKDSPSKSPTTQTQSIMKGHIFHKTRGKVKDKAMDKRHQSSSQQSTQQTIKATKQTLFF